MNDLKTHSEEMAKVHGGKGGWEVNDSFPPDINR